MKKWLSILIALAMMLAMACAALADEAAEGENDAEVTEEELMGVWKLEDSDDLQVLILPGSYAPVASASKIPELYVEAKWREGSDKYVLYNMMVNRWKPQHNNFLSTLLGTSMANALQVISGIGKNQEDLNRFGAFEYSKAPISVIWTYEEGLEEYNKFTDNASGTFYALRVTGNEVMLYWVDDYDPHVAGVELIHQTVAVPAAEALTEGVLRPVIDKTDDVQVQAALDVLRWASEKECVKMNAAALAENLSAALNALTPTEVQAFRDNFGKISTMSRDAMGLNRETWSNPDRKKPFEDAGLGDALGALSGSVENQRSVEVLLDAIGKALG